MIQNLIHDTHLLTINKDYKGLATKLIEIIEFIEVTKSQSKFEDIESHAAFDIEVYKATRHYENTVSTI